MKRQVFALLMSILFPVFCIAKIPPPPPEKSKPDIEWFFEALRNSNGLQIFEGLPHPFWEPEERENELSTHETKEIAKETFYSQKLLVSDDVKNGLTASFIGQSLIEPFSPNSIETFKQCGGFHGDYALQWLKDKEPIVTALICFGCNEVLVVSTEASFKTDMTEAGCEYLAGTLKPLRSQRPPFRHLAHLREFKKQLPPLEAPEKIQIETK